VEPWAQPQAQQQATQSTSSNRVTTERESAVSP
jgi:hypothetical protein